MIRCILRLVLWASYTKVFSVVSALQFDNETSGASAVHFEGTVSAVIMVHFWLCGRLSTEFDSINSCRIVKFVAHSRFSFSGAVLVLSMMGPCHGFSMEFGSTNSLGRGAASAPSSDEEFVVHS
eukprot:Filipodium_phascolosomae@DN4685_c0_g1_i1.p1